MILSLTLRLWVFSLSAAEGRRTAWRWRSPVSRPPRLGGSSRR